MLPRATFTVGVKALPMAPGFKIIILLAATHFEAAIPQVPSLVQQSFPDTPAGVEAFAAWLRPHWRQLSQNADAPVFCVVASEPLPAAHRSTVSSNVQLSESPLHAFEPFSAAFRYISPFEQNKGVVRRSMAEAILLCNGKRL